MTSRIGLEYMTEGLGNEVRFNQLVNLMDCVIGGVKELSYSVTTPVDGDSYIVGVGATGSFLGWDNYLAFYRDGWTFIEPKEGMNFWVQSLSQYLYFNGDHWTTPGLISDGIYKLTASADTTYIQLPEDIYYGWGLPNDPGGLAPDEVIYRMLPVNPAIGKTIIFYKANDSNVGFILKPSTSASPLHVLIDDATGSPVATAGIPKEGYKKFVYIAEGEWRFYAFTHLTA